MHDVNSAIVQYWVANPQSFTNNKDSKYMYIYIYIYINNTFVSQRVIFGFLPKLQRLNKITKSVKRIYLKTN